MNVQTDIFTVHFNCVFGGGEGLCGIYAKQFKGNTVLKDAVYYGHPDHLGSLAIITDANGVVKQKCTFDAWGKSTLT